MTESPLFDGQIFLRFLDGRIEIGIDGKCLLIPERLLRSAIMEAARRHLEEQAPKIN